MLEDQVAFLLQKYLGNYVLGLNREALKISVWQGDVELTNMQLKPEALNALKLPVKVKAGFLGSVKIKVPWSRLGQEPVLVYLDRIFLLVEPATTVEGFTEDAVQEAKKSRVRDMEMKLLETQQQLKLEMNTSWLGSLINTIIGNLKLSITNIHIRYEDLESNPGHPFAAGLTLAKLAAVTVDNDGRETFATGGALQRINKSVELERLAFYLDSDISPWKIEKPWVDLSPAEWSQVFEVSNNSSQPTNALKEHCYILQPVTGNAKYSKPRQDECNNPGQALQKAEVYLDDVTLCLSKDGYRDILKLVENFSAFDLRLKYAHHRPLVPVKSNPRAWWKYACKAVSDQLKKASGKLTWEQVLRYTSLRKRYISLYASLLKADVSRMVVDDNEEIVKLDRELDIDLILQWRMLAHKFVEQSTDLSLKKQKTSSSWWSLGWSTSSAKDENEPWHFGDEDWERLNKIIGYKESDAGQILTTQAKGNQLLTSLEVHMRHNASRLVAEAQTCLAELSCESLDCSVQLYSETKVFDLKLGSYRLSSPNGLLAESAAMNDSLVGVFSLKPFGTEVDWSLVAKASPCYVTYLKDSIDQIMKFFENSAAVSQTISMETAAAVQMTIDGVKRSAQQQVTRALKDRSRFFLDLDIAAPKIAIPTKFSPDNSHATRLLLDLGNFKLRTQDDGEVESQEEMDMYLQFNLGLSDVSAFLVDGDYHWSQNLTDMSVAPNQSSYISFLPVIEKCGLVVNLQQIRSENPSYPSTRVAVRLPSLGFHFSPARYHRLMQVVKIFQNEESENSDYLPPWTEADFEGWLSVLAWKGVGNREAVWQRRYCCLVGSFLYVLESPQSKNYKHYVSLRGKQLYEVPAELAGDVEHILAICDSGQSNIKVLEDASALILRFESEDSRKIWQRRCQGAIYRSSASAPIAALGDTSSDSGDTEAEFDNNDIDLVETESVFFTGALDELKISFSYNQNDLPFKPMLLAEESRLFEFRAIGGQVEVSIRGKAMLIGTVLKTLEVEDLVLYEGLTQPRYLARSFIKQTDTSDASELFYDVGPRRYSSSDLTQNEGEDNFFEASENLGEPTDSPAQMLENKPFANDKLVTKPPSFSRIDGILPDYERQTRIEGMITDSLDSFVKAQIVIHDPNSSLYNNVDNEVVVTLATLSFFCYRPTIVAILKFVTAINVSDESSHASSDKSSAERKDSSWEDTTDDQNLSAVQEPAVKGLLGKGKSRVIFYLSLNMARAEILLMKENGMKLATLSQNNFLTDIKVFPSTFSIKAALGNLKISDDSLPSSHSYFWVCDMRNPGGSSFVELLFTSFSVGDEDYEGYDFSLFGQLSEVRIVYLNRFIQEIASYFMGLVPNDSKDVVKVKDQVTNAEKWFTTSEIEGSPALKLDLSLNKPIIVMPKRTDSLDYLELDVVQITVQNKFQWLQGDKNEMGAVHLETLTVQVQDINLTVGTATGRGESIIHDVVGLSVVIKRSLRDLLHQIPTTEAAIKIGELKAALSNKEYQIISECALSNLSETPKPVPPLNQQNQNIEAPSDITMELSVPLPSGVEVESQDSVVWVAMKVSVAIDLVELSLHSGETRDAALATVQASGAWLLFKSNTIGEGFLSATLKDFTVVDDREGTKQEFRLAIGKPGNLEYGPLFSTSLDDNEHNASIGKSVLSNTNVNPIPTMLIVDAKFYLSSTSISLCVQRPQLLVALDFLLAVVEFFVPTVGTMLSNTEDDNPPHIANAIILDQPIYNQPSAEFSLSPQTPLIADDERFDHFIYDGKGGTLHLRDRWGSNLRSPSTEAIIYVGSGKTLQFKNVVIKNGHYLDSSILLGTNSSYSAFKEDQVFLERENEDSLNSSEESLENAPTQNSVPDKPTEIVFELQAIGPELNFYNTSKDVEESSTLSNKLLHAQLDAFCRLVIKGDTLEMSANTLGLTMESNGVRILEPFDTSIEFSSASGKTNIHVAVTDIFMNFSFSILRLFLAVEEDILTFLRMTSKKVTLVCSEFDKVGTLTDSHSDRRYAFWRPRAPPGFAVLGDYLTPTDKPPTKRVLAVNPNFVKVKRPVSFKLVWSSAKAEAFSDSQGANGSNESSAAINTDNREDNNCSIWFPVAPPGYVAMGCVVSSGVLEPPVSSALCILASLVSPCDLRDCVTISFTEPDKSTLAFWRVDNSIGTFLPADSVNMNLIGRAYELRHVIFQYMDGSSKASRGTEIRDITPGPGDTLQSERSVAFNSGRRFEAVASFKLVWWNKGSSSRKKISVWRPSVPSGMVYLGDIAVQGYEPPNTCLVLRDTVDELAKVPLDFQLVGQIKKQRGTESISFWLPLAPPGFVSLGCIACKGTPKKDDFSLLRCIRSDMVTGDQFSEESIWDTSDVRISTEPFSLWTVGNEVGTFLVRSGFRKPPKRYALRLADSNITSGSDDTVVDAEIQTFSAAVFDDYGGLMVPLFNVSLGGIGFSLHGRPGNLNSTMSFSLAARSYNDKYDSWEPLVESMDGFVRYQYDQNSPGAASQLRLTSTRELNLIISVSNINMILQAYASWNNLIDAHASYKKYIRQDTVTPNHEAKSIIGFHHKRNYYIVPQNKLGQDIFIRATQMRGLHNIIRMPSGDVKPVRVPVSKDMLDSHLKGKLGRKFRAMATIIIVDGQFPAIEGLTSRQYTVAIGLVPNECLPSGSLLKEQSARTSGVSSDCSLLSGLELVVWNETFFFKVDSPDYYMVEMIVTDIGQGEPVGFYSAPLNKIRNTLNESSDSYGSIDELNWIELSSTRPTNVPSEDDSKQVTGKIRCAFLISPMSEENGPQTMSNDKKGGLIQISPTKEGPWTTVKLNYSAPAACWRLGNDVVASEVSVKDGNRLVNIRSLVSVSNNSEFILDVSLALKDSDEISKSIDGRQEDKQVDSDGYETDEFYETEKYNPPTGWVGYSTKQMAAPLKGVDSHQEISDVELPLGWKWIDNWHVDNASVSTSDGWVYAPDLERLQWPESYSQLKYVNYARQRRWIRKRKRISGGVAQKISVGLLNPGDTIPLPLAGLTQLGRTYILQLRPSNGDERNEYSWSSVVDRHHVDSGKTSEICVSNLSESEELLHCTHNCSESSSSSRNNKDLWFCLSIKATEIGKDIRLDPIQDWNLVVKPPLSISNFLPLSANFSVHEMQENGQTNACSEGVFSPSETVGIYNADLRKPIYFSLRQEGWLPITESVLLSHPSLDPSKTFNMRSSFSERIVQVILEQNHDKEQKMVSRIIRLYAPYWIASARCPPLTYRLVATAGKKKGTFPFPYHSKQNGEMIVEEISEREIFDGYTIDSALNFKLMGLSVSISQSGKKQFGLVKDLSALGDMDGTVEVYANDDDGNCIHLFVSSKPCPYQSVPTKVISVRPFMTFTNRIGQDIFIKLSSEDFPKILHASDSRVSFVYRKTEEPRRLQVRLEDTEWCFPIEIAKEDTISMVLRTPNGDRRFLTTEIRGYEEGSRFIVVFRLGSTNGPIIVENRTNDQVIRIRQSGFNDDSWIRINALSTTNFSWEDPYGEKLIDAEICGGSVALVQKFSLATGECFSSEGTPETPELQFDVMDMGDFTIARFTNHRTSESISNGDATALPSTGYWVNSDMQQKVQNAAPIEIMIELGVVGVSMVDHRPRELSYLYLERVLISYSTGYDGGNTSRFKLRLGHLQLDNQLPLSLMPVLLAPERITDVHHPVLKMTFLMRNDNTNGTLVYPYVFIKVTEKTWRLNVHEPIIWALVDFYNNLQMDRIPKSSSVTQVDPEIRVDLIDISEVRLKIKLETAPSQRPRGVLGVWSPILSAVGNAFRIQIHLRKVMHRNRFMRQSSVVPAITNRIWRDLIHNPLHLLFSVDVLGMTSSTLASLSRGFAELSTDGQFLQLRSKQVWSRKITGVGDGILQGTEALAQGFAFGVSGVLTKPVENARQNGLLGLAHGLGQAFLGFIVQPVSGALDFFSLTVDGIGASCTRCLEVFSNKANFQRIRNPRTIYVDGILREYSEREATGQMILYLAEASRHFGCTEIFKEPSKYALSDYYEEHFIVPYQRIVLVTSKRVMLLQCMAPDKMDKKPSKIMWDVPWEDLMSLELAKAGYSKPSHLILHLKNFKRSERFVRLIKCNVEETEEEPQAVRICSVINKVWKAHRSDTKCLTLKVPSSQRHVYFTWEEADKRESRNRTKPIFKPREYSAVSVDSSDRRFIKRTFNFQKIWSSEPDSKGRFTLSKKQVMETDGMCSIWRPTCPDGYVSIGDIARVGNHPPNVSAIYHNVDGQFALPVGYDLVWRNCIEDYATPVSIWYPRAPEGFVSLGCVAVAGFTEPEDDVGYCVKATLAEETVFEEQKVWMASNSYPWACHIYQVQSEALNFVALRQPKEEAELKPMRVIDDQQSPPRISEETNTIT